MKNIRKQTNLFSIMRKSIQSTSPHQKITTTSSLNQGKLEELKLNVTLQKAVTNLHIIQ